MCTTMLSNEHEITYRVMCSQSIAWVQAELWFCAMPSVTADLQSPHIQTSQWGRFYDLRSLHSHSSDHSFLRCCQWLCWFPPPPASSCSGFSLIKLVMDVFCLVHHDVLYIPYLSDVCLLVWALYTPGVLCDDSCIQMSGTEAKLSLWSATGCSLACCLISVKHF